MLGCVGYVLLRVAVLDVRVGAAKGPETRLTKRPWIRHLDRFIVWQKRLTVRYPS